MGGRRVITSTLAIGFATALLAMPASAGQRQDLTAQIEALKKQIADQQAQLEVLSAQVQDVKVSSANQFSESQRQTSESPKLQIKDGRPTFVSGDGKATISLRGRISLDYGNIIQDDAGPLASDFRRGSFGDVTESSHARDLNDGTNFRRAQLGLEGKLGDDWAYSLVYEFGGGGGQEDGGRIQDLYLQYNGLEWVRLRAGAFSPSVGYDDSTSNAESIFLERASPAELSRQIAGSEGRNGIAAYANGDEWYASVALTGAPVTTPGSATSTQNYDEQLAVVARAAWLLYKSSDINLHVGANSTYVFRAPDQGPDIALRHTLRLRDRPEIRVDGTRLIDTGNINTDSLWIPGLEFAASFQNFYVQGEHFWYRFEREQIPGPVLPDPDFSGWYVQAAYVLTGETRNWNAVSGVFSAPKPAQPFTPGGDGIGAWEIALRYSDTDLNYRADLLPGAGGIRGGEQKAWTAGLNWYVNSNIRFLLDYQWVDVDRASTGAANAYGAGVFVPPAGAQIGQDLEIVSLRTQFTF
ncbi:MAG: porin [Alphaproteobacteria bacterium]|nr:porin [Alphaproteobacteria bacterium]